MSRREFPRSVKVAVIKRCTRDNVVYCEKCSLPARKWQIDHVRPDGLLGDPVLENAMLICKDCYDVKNPDDTKKIAKAKRREAFHLGVKSSGPKIQSRGFSRVKKDRSNTIGKLAGLPPPPLLRGK